MNKLNYLLLGAAGLMLASCSQEEVAPVNGGDGNVTVTINLPNTIRTRAVDAFGEGLVSQQLSYAVYDGNSENLVTEGVGVFPANALSTTVNLNLAKGKTYKIAFFAQSAASQGADAVYTFSAENKQITVNYANMTSANNIDDAYDCFYGVLETLTVGTSDLQTSVTLTRPVAQINWGSSDLKEGNPAAHVKAYGNNGRYVVSALTTKAYNTLGLLTGEVEGTPEDIVIGMVSNEPSFASPWQYTFPLGQADDATSTASNYAYIAMNYVLAPVSAPANYDLTLDVTNSGNTTLGKSAETSLIVAQVPVQANYQTNIYGALLSDNANFNVTINPQWNTPAYEVAVWDGSSTTPAIDTENKSVSLESPSDLAGLADIVNGKTTVAGVPANLAGYTITLAEDVDLNGLAAPSFGSATLSGANGSPTATDGTGFAGTFDGNGKTISNALIAGTANTDDNAITAMFPVVDGGTVKNLNFKNVTIAGPAATSPGTFNATGVVGIVSNGGTVSGVNVTSGEVNGGNYTAGVVGAVIDNGTVENCSNGASVSGNNIVGGVVGGAYSTAASHSMTISGCSNSGEVTGSWTTGGVIGLSNANVDQCTNDGVVKAANNSIGGVVAEQRGSGRITRCNNTAEVSCTGDTPTNNLGYGVGGIVGWVRYIQQGDAVLSAIEVSNCSNSGSIEGGIGVAGIVGIWYWGGTCVQNTNTATSLVAESSNVAGIVGQTNGSTANSSVEGVLTISGNISTTPVTSMSITSGATSIAQYANDGSTTSYTVTIENNSDTLAD